MPETPRPAADDRPAETTPGTPEAARAGAPAPAGKVPTAPAPAASAPDGAGHGTPAESAPRTPDEAELARLAVPATVRRAPRYKAFMVAGALVGALVGLVLAVVTSDGVAATSDGGVLPFLGGDNAVRWLLALALGFVGVLVGGAVALVVDRRSTRRRRPAPRD